MKEECLEISISKNLWRICKSRSLNSKNLKLKVNKSLKKCKNKFPPQKHNQNLNQQLLKKNRHQNKQTQLKMLKMKAIMNIKRRILKKQLNSIKKQLTLNQRSHCIITTKLLPLLNLESMLKLMNNLIKQKKYLKMEIKILSRKPKF